MVPYSGRVKMPLLWWLEWEMSLVGSGIWKLISQVVAQFVEVMGPLGGGALLEEVLQGLQLHFPTSSLLSLFLCGWKCDLSFPLWLSAVMPFPPLWTLFLEVEAKILSLKLLLVMVSSHSSRKQLTHQCGCVFQCSVSSMCLDMNMPAYVLQVGKMSLLQSHTGLHCYSVHVGLFLCTTGNTWLSKANRSKGIGLWDQFECL